jgi:DNA-directed RNA polymerase beta subunit
MSDGTVTSVTGSKIVVTKDDGKEDVYNLMKFVRTNQGTCITQKPIVTKATGEIRPDTGRQLGHRKRRTGPGP